MNGPRTHADEFYVGYMVTPRGLSRFARLVCATLAACALVGGGLIAWAQRNPGGAEWESHERTLRGVLVALPYPVLMLDKPGAESLGRAWFSRASDEFVPVLLVDPGKFGTQGRAGALDGRRVEMRGTLLSRHGRLMLEVAAGEGALRAVNDEPARDEDRLRLSWARRELGTVSLQGEIVDSKCYMGAMKPGQGKIHKACAVICVLGGIPPVLVTHDAEGLVEYYVLANEAGGPVGEWLVRWVGEPVEVAGELESLGGLLVLRIKPDGVQAAR
jgi:hypothetical protein